MPLDCYAPNTKYKNYLNTIYKKSIKNLDDYPLFMKYFHGDINQWIINTT